MLDNLTKDELLFELQAKGLEMDAASTVDELKQQFKSAKGTALDTIKANFLSQACPLMTNFRSAKESWMQCCADRTSSSCRRRCLSKLAHVILRSTTVTAG